jgi:hypothetical protein
MRIVVAGMLAADPGQGGASWAVLQYVLGFQRLGHDVLLVEPTTEARLDDPIVRAYFGAAVAGFGLQGRAALVAGERSLGVPYAGVTAFAKDASLLLNISGMVRDPAIFEPVPIRVYLDLDPGFNQLWQSVDEIDMGFEGHSRFFTVGLAIGTEACDVPTCGRSWTATLPPVVLERWPVAGAFGIDAFTTVANWRSYGSIQHGDVQYGQKAHSFRTLLPLPSRSGERFAPALAIDPGDDADLRALRDCGWEVRDASVEAGTPDAYQAFVRTSRAELGVAKSGYVVSGSGWFSDRSAAYLASGRPVLAQDTGFSSWLPTGEGLLAFDDLDGAVGGVAELRRGYDAHARAARAVAESHLDSSR